MNILPYKMENKEMNKIKKILDKYNIIKGTELDQYLCFQKQMLDSGLFSAIKHLEESDSNIAKLAIYKLTFSGFEDFKKIIKSDLITQDQRDAIAKRLLTYDGCEQILSFNAYWDGYDDASTNNYYKNIFFCNNTDLYISSMLENMKNLIKDIKETDVKEEDLINHIIKEYNKAVMFLLKNGYVHFPSLYKDRYSVKPNEFEEGYYKYCRRRFILSERMVGEEDNNCDNIHINHSLLNSILQFIIDEKVYFYELKEDLHNLIGVLSNINYMNKYDSSEFLESIKLIRKIKSDMENNI